MFPEPLQLNGNQIFGTAQWLGMLNFCSNRLVLPIVCWLSEVNLLTSQSQLSPVTIQQVLLLYNLWSFPPSLTPETQYQMREREREERGERREEREREREGEGEGGGEREGGRERGRGGVSNCLCSEAFWHAFVCF